MEKQQGTKTFNNFSHYTFHTKEVINSNPNRIQRVKSIFIVLQDYVSKIVKILITMFIF